MSTSQQVNTLRKQGDLDAAYAMAQRIVAEDPDDDWNVKALIYCLNDLVKRAVGQNDFVAAQSFAGQLSELHVDPYDEILVKTVQRARMIANPQMKEIVDAKKLSFEKNHEAAYPLFKSAFALFPNDSDLVKSFGWTIYYLLKQAIENKQKPQIITLLKDCQDIKDALTDGSLLEQMARLAELADEERQIIRDAKAASKADEHEKALELFREAVRKFPDDNDLHEQFAWQLYKDCKAIFAEDKVDVQKARQLLAEYIRLKNTRPSQIHSMFLRLADKIKDKEEFGFAYFLKLWDLSHLRDEDYKGFEKEDKVYPSVAEMVIQHGAKSILDKKLINEVNWFLPYLDKGISTFRENIWLTYYKAKLLHLVHRNDEAVTFLTPVVKEKIGEYWTWNLLADLMASANPELSLSCFCKALLCNGEEKFLANVRIRFVEVLVARELYPEAKYEIKTAVMAKEAEGVKVPDKVRVLSDASWYSAAAEKTNNFDFYNNNKGLAEEYIFHDLPWLEACLGESYTLPDKPNKPKRKLYIKASSQVIEVSVSNKKFMATRRGQAGDNIQVKGEYDKDKHFQVYLLEKRSAGQRFDIFETVPATVVQQLRNDDDRPSGLKVALITKGKMKEGIFRFSEGAPARIFEEGAAVSVRFHIKLDSRSLASFSYKTPDEKLHILEIQPRPEGIPWDSFQEYVGVIDHINTEKGIAHFIISKEIDGVTKLDQLPQDVEVGQKLAVRLRKVQKDKSDTRPSSSVYYRVLTCQRTDKTLSYSVLTAFAGMLRPSGNIGFVDDVFIDANLMSLCNELTYKVKGVAILSFNKKRSSWGWKAITVEND